MDLEEYVALSDEEVICVGLKTRELLSKLRKFPIPTIACVEGPAIGSGAELALACDFRIGGQRAVFSFPETRLGLIPMGGLVQRLSEIVGLGKAKELVFTGRSVDCEEALRLGLLDDYGEGSAEQKALNLATEMRLGAPLALRAAKRSLEGDKSDEHDADLLRMLIARDDRKEGVKALLEKRKPHYRGR